MDLQLTKKIALVTGSTAGIGRAIAASLAREGSTVIINGRTRAAVDGAVAEMRAEIRGLAASPGTLPTRRSPQPGTTSGARYSVNNLGIFEVRPFGIFPTPTGGFFR